MDSQVHQLRDQILRRTGGILHVIDGDFIRPGNRFYHVFQDIRRYASYSLLDLSDGGSDNFCRDIADGVAFGKWKTVQKTAALLLFTPRQFIPEILKSLVAQRLHKPHDGGLADSCPFSDLFQR